MTYKVLAIAAALTGEAQVIYLVVEESTTTGALNVKARSTASSSAQTLCDTLNGA